MMLAIVQEQHQEQLNAMRESNKAVMEMATAAMAQMTKQMSTICAANAVRETTADEDKENVPPGFAALRGPGGWPARGEGGLGRVGWRS